MRQGILICFNLKIQLLKCLHITNQSVGLLLPKLKVKGRVSVVKQKMIARIIGTGSYLPERSFES